MNTAQRNETGNLMSPLENVPIFTDAVWLGSSCLHDNLYEVFRVTTTQEDRLRLNAGELVVLNQRQYVLQGSLLSPESYKTDDLLFVQNLGVPS